MTLSRRSYERIATAIRDEIIVSDKKAIESLETLAIRLVYVFEDDNPRFDRVKFLQACGLKSIPSRAAGL